MEDTTEQFSADEEGELGDDPLHYEDPVMHISGAGHWFLEGWIGDHSVEFLVDSGSSVTAMSDVLYGRLLQAVHRWVHFRLQHGRCAVRMEQASKYWGVRAARCRFWDCERSSPLSSAAWRRERTRSLGQMCWDRCCHIRSTSRMDCYLHRWERHFSYTGGFGPVGSRVPMGHSSIPPYSEAVLHCSVQTTGGRALPSSGLLED